MLMEYAIRLHLQIFTFSMVFYLQYLRGDFVDVFCVLYAKKLLLLICASCTAENLNISQLAGMLTCIMTSNERDVFLPKLTSTDQAAIASVAAGILQRAHL